MKRKRKDPRTPKEKEMKVRPFYCPSCKQRFEYNDLKDFIDHALELHGRIYSSKPKADNYEILMK